MLFIWNAVLTGDPDFYLLNLASLYSLHMDHAQVCYFSEHQAVAILTLPSRPDKHSWSSWRWHKPIKYTTSYWLDCGQHNKVSDVISADLLVPCNWSKKLSLQEMPLELGCMCQSCVLGVHETQNVQNWTQYLSSFPKKTLFVLSPYTLVKRNSPGLPMSETWESFWVHSWHQFNDPALPVLSSPATLILFNSFLTSGYVLILFSLNLYFTLELGKVIILPCLRHFSDFLLTWQIGSS